MLPCKLLKICSSSLLLLKPEVPGVGDTYRPQELGPQSVDGPWAMGSGLSQTRSGDVEVDWANLRASIHSRVTWSGSSI